MSNQLVSFLKETQESVEMKLQEYLAELEAPPQLLEAMNYSLMAGGKRIRPAFLLATLDAFGKERMIGYPAACAIEMLHTYSLIHDDLPAMDDDDYRRGKLTNHKVFGEAMAILAGDALLTHAFYLLTHSQPAPLTPPLPPAIQLQMVKELAYYSGARGMVGGQVVDILGEEKSLSLDELYYIHEHKTADLLVCSVRFGAYLGEASLEQMSNLTQYAYHIGLAFQIQDDILDEVGDETKLGKKVGSDRENNKTTFVSLLGIEGARDKLEKHIELAKASLRKADLNQTLLLDLAEFMVKRDT